MRKGIAHLNRRPDRHLRWPTAGHNAGGFQRRSVLRRLGRRANEEEASAARRRPRAPLNEGRRCSCAYGVSRTRKRARIRPRPLSLRLPA